MVNNLSIGTVITANPSVSSTLYLVRQIDYVNTELLSFTDAGVPIDTIDSVGKATLFFDNSGNYYCLNDNDRIAQYNFATKELDELAGQTSDWTKKFIARLDDGSFMTSDEAFNPGTTNWEIVIERYDIDGTLLESSVLTGINYEGLSVAPLESFSTNGTITTISWYNNVHMGTATYTASGMLDTLTIENLISEESGGTMHANLLYTMTESVMRVRDLDDGMAIVNEITIAEYNEGSIGVKAVSAGTPFKALVLNIDSTNPTTDTIPDDFGNPVLFVSPGRKIIEVSTQQNMDAYLDGEVEPFIIEGETFEIESIFVEGNTYQITLQTPETS